MCLANNNKTIQEKEAAIRQNEKLNDPAAKQRVKDLKTQVAKLKQENANASVDKIYESNVQKIKNNNDNFKDLNKSLRENLVNVFEQGVKTVKDNFNHARDYGTHMELSPVNISSANTIVEGLNNKDFSKHFVVEYKDKNGKSVWKDLSELGDVKFKYMKGFAAKSPLGVPMATVGDEDGNTYNITANVDTPQMNWLVNTSIAGMDNPSAMPGYWEVAIPSAGKISAAMQFNKLKGKSGGSITIKKSNKDFKIYYGGDGNGYVVDPYKINANSQHQVGTPQWLQENALNSTPFNHIEMGKIIENYK